MGNIQAGDKQLKTGKSPAKGKNFIRNLNRKSPGRDSKKHGRKKSDAKRDATQFDKTPDSDNADTLECDNDIEARCVGGSARATAAAAQTQAAPQVTVPRSPTHDGAPARSPADSATDSVFADPLTPLAVELNLCYYSAESSGNSAHDEPRDPSCDMPHMEEGLATAQAMPVDAEKEEISDSFAVKDVSGDRSDDVMGSTFAKGASLERQTHECNHEFRENRLKASHGTTSFTLSKHRKVELAPTVCPPSLLDADISDRDRRPSSLSDAPLDSNVLRKVASLTLDKASSEHKVLRPKFVPEKLNFQLYEKFEGQMLLNWFVSSIADNNNLKNLFTSQDLRSLGCQYCTHLLAAGVLRQICDKNAPTENVFKPSLMYYWAHMEAPMSQPVTPGRLQMPKWPPDRDTHHITQEYDKSSASITFPNENNNDDITDIFEAKATISQLRHRLEDLEYQLEKLKLAAQIEALNESLKDLNTEKQPVCSEVTQLVSKATQTNITNDLDKLSIKPVINIPERDPCLRTINVNNNRTLDVSIDCTNNENEQPKEEKLETRSDKLENFCKLNKSRESNSASNTEDSPSKANDTGDLGAIVRESLRSMDSSELSFKSSYMSNDYAAHECESTEVIASNQLWKPGTRTTHVLYEANKVNSGLDDSSSAELYVTSYSSLKTTEQTASQTSHTSCTKDMHPANKLMSPSSAATSITSSLMTGTPKSPEHSKMFTPENSITSIRSDKQNQSEQEPQVLQEFKTSTSADHPPYTPLAPSSPPISEAGPLSPAMPQIESISPPPPPPMPSPPSISGLGPPPPSMSDICPTPHPMSGMGPVPPPMPGMGPPPPPMPVLGPPPPPMPVLGPPPPPMPGLGPPPPPLPVLGPPPPPMPVLGPPPPPMPGLGPPPPPMPSFGPPPPPMPGLGPPPPPMPGMCPPPPPMPGMGPGPPPMPGMGPGPPPMPGMPPPPGMGPPPPPPMQGSASSGPVPFPAPPVGGWNNQRATLRKVPIKPAAPMKPLYWTRILAPPPPPVQGEPDMPAVKPLWLQIEEANLDNIEEFTDLFSRQVIKAPVKKKVEVKTKIKPAKILDSKRSQNVGILAQSLHVEFSEIENAIYNFDTSVVSLEALQQIYELRATDEELAMIRAHLEQKPDVPLDRPEAFLVDLSGIPNFAERISCFMFQAEFEDAVSTTMHKLDNLKHTCEFLIKNENLKKLFAIILTLGNYMNGGNGQRGQADGFGLEILSKLKDVKSKQSNVTLLHFIVRTYMRACGGALCPECALPVPEPGDVARAAAVDFADVVGALKALASQLAVCKEKTKKVMETDAQPSTEDVPSPEASKRLVVFQEKMTSFLTSADEKLSTESENLEECRGLFMATVKFYQYTPKTCKLEDFEPKEFFALWTSFCVDFKDIYKKEEQIAIKEKDSKHSTLHASLSNFKSVDQSYRQCPRFSTISHDRQDALVEDFCLQALMAGLHVLSCQVDKLKEAKKQQGERRPVTQPKKEGGLKARLQKLSSSRK